MNLLLCFLLSLLVDFIVFTLYNGGIILVLLIHIVTARSFLVVILFVVSLLVIVFIALLLFCGRDRYVIVL